MKINNKNQHRFKKSLQWLYNLVLQFCDPLRLVRGLAEVPRYIANWRIYSRLSGAEPIRLLDFYPQLHDRTFNIPIETHYFYMNGWAARRILKNQPTIHVDIGSQIIFANLLSTIIPVVFLDYRPLNTKISNLYSVGGNILRLPFADGVIESLSCLHVAEHIGLGRYGDPLDPLGTKKAASEIVRVLAFEGDLYFAVPIGKPRLCFNAHRIHLAKTICEYFSDLELIEFSAIHDDGRFIENADLHAFDDCSYTCGLFWFKKGNFS